ncbi:hypothetical protein BDW59DRAFT_61231 [Aspergillus cavernicola]|uniref:SnoaL-like domain-containing protein n=1 Tax=Aspergillus cavernicola TaxID=176166 RepID=A0ABR4IGD9_9EURO
MSTSYKITTSPTLLPPKASSMISFMESFYSISDTESQHSAYVNSFTPDATLIMGPKTAHGADEILTLRNGLWTHVASRKHTPSRIYFGADNELMLHGVVRYVLKKSPGEEVEVEWAGRVVFDMEGELRMRFYQVYLDPSAQSGKK